MDNIVTAAELERRGMAAIEQGLRSGPVHIVKRNKLAAVVLSEPEYARLAGAKGPGVPDLCALQWLLSQSGAGRRSKAQVDAALKAERNW